jgi:hypothetical protein
MKVEFLAEGATECPLIRLFDYRAGELERLRIVCSELGDRPRAEFPLHDQPWIEPIAECKFTWRAGARNAGVQFPVSGTAFVLELAGEAWHEVSDKLLPFIDGSGGYNWLTNEGDVNVLISRDGTW